MFVDFDTDEVPLRSFFGHGARRARAEESDPAPHRPGWW